ncbi:hypothetical protein HPB48_019395 [Haemaphysalis longicornis]|uniref:SH3 domain-containing protein n=1 Tax=Haemaphysalis longicornis TaxID=44386 RepID=A0A9J6GQ65_HAELO|nr:hypothetical protein HPB48_019395 [Haemaphysalis longicornis]
MRWAPRFRRACAIIAAQSELAFSTGDVIYVYGDMDEDGFYFGECRGQQGLVPSNFLTEAPADYADSASAAGQQRPGGSRHGSMQHKGTRAPPLHFAGTLRF